MRSCRYSLLNNVLVMSFLNFFLFFLSKILIYSNASETILGELANCENATNPINYGLISENSPVARNSIAHLIQLMTLHIDSLQRGFSCIPNIG